MNLVGGVTPAAFGDAVNVADLVSLGQGVELGPILSGDGLRPHLQGEGPVVGADLWRGARGQDREVGGQRLARRQSLGGLRRRLPSGESTRDHALSPLLEAVPTPMPDIYR
jgi:hypothetical protein